MKLKEFREHYDYAPFELREFAQAAMDVTDNKKLSEAALDYLTARKVFEKILDELEIEVG